MKYIIKKENGEFKTTYFKMWTSGLPVWTLYKEKAKGFGSPIEAREFKRRWFNPNKNIKIQSI